MIFFGLILERTGGYLSHVLDFLSASRCFHFSLSFQRPLGIISLPASHFLRGPATVHPKKKHLGRAAPSFWVLLYYIV
jgi:hypothetical protein